MNRINYWEALRRRWWLLVVLGLVGLVVGLLVPTSPAKAHTGKWATFALVGSAPAIGGTASDSGPGYVSLAQVQYYSKNTRVIEAAAKAVGIKKSLTELEAMITSAAPKAGGKVTESGVLRLRTEASTPKLSAAFSNAYANQLGIYLQNLADQSLQQRVHQAQSRVTALQAELNAAGGAKRSPAGAERLSAAQQQLEELQAIVPNTGYSVLEPALASSATNLSKSGVSLHLSHAVYGLLGLIVGLLIGAIIVVAGELTDERLRTAARAAEAFGYPVAAEIPAPETSARTDLPLARTVDSHAEAYRKLRMSVLLENLAGQGADRSARNANGATKRQVVLVLSPADEPSRSAVVDNLAAASAEAGQRAIVVDALGSNAGEGGSALLDDGREPDVDDVENRLEPSRLKNVALLKLTDLIGSSSLLLTRAPAVLDVARAIADIVIIEAPPLLAFHDGEALASVSDVVLVVGECGRTSVAQAQRAGELLRRFDAPVLGVVFTEVRVKSGDLVQADRARDSSYRQSKLEPRAAPPVVVSPQAEQ